VVIPKLKKHTLRKLISQDPYTQEIFGKMEIIDKTFLKIRTKLEMVFCSDGGVRENRAGFGMVGSVEGKIVVECHHRLHEIYNDYNSHRSEAWGILSMELITEYRMIQQLNTEMTFSVLCDNKSVVDTLNITRYHKPSIKNYKSADFDIIDTIRQKWSKFTQMNIQIKITHIKGHQDKRKKFLTTYEELNVAADILATKSLQYKSTTNKFKELADASMHINNLLVTHDYTTILRQNHLSVDLQEYLRESNGWSGLQTEHIWWAVHEASLEALSKKKRRFIQKFIHKKLPCNYRQQKYYNYKSSVCMNCKEDIETQDHIFRCKLCPKRNKLKAQYFKDLTILLENNRTNVSTSEMIKQNVKNWFNIKTVVDALTIAPDATNTLKMASTQQQEIGWDHWIKGRWSQEWATLQNYDINQNDSGKKYATSIAWAKEIILLTWDLIHQIWIERNNSEHDSAGCPEIRKKEKLIETIQGESYRMQYAIYSELETGTEKLIQLPEDNLKMIKQNLKNAKAYTRSRVIDKL
jgi:hypothetical protein